MLYLSRDEHDDLATIDTDDDAAAELADERWHEQRMDDRIAADWDQQAQLRRAEAGWLRKM